MLYVCALISCSSFLPSEESHETQANQYQRKHGQNADAEPHETNKVVPVGCGGSVDCACRVRVVDELGDEDEADHEAENHPDDAED